jgi:DNA-binding MarR family transcriptional regulator
MTQTQLNGYVIIHKLPIQGSCQDLVYNFIKENEETTRQDIAEQTGLQINNVCGRVFELMDMGLIEAYKVEGERRERLVLTHETA